MFGLQKKPPSKEFDLKQFNLALTDLLAEAIQNRIALPTLINELADRIELLEMRFAQRPVI
jgi:hypothetical protein